MTCILRKKGSGIKPGTVQNQVAIYEAANRTRTSVKAIVCYTATDQARAAKTLKDLKIANDPSVVVIDARSDNKPSASKA